MRRFFYVSAIDPTLAWPNAILCNSFGIIVRSRTGQLLRKDEEKEYFERGEVLTV